MSGIPPDAQPWVAAVILAAQIWQTLAIIKLQATVASLTTKITGEIHQ